MKAFVVLNISNPLVHSIIFCSILLFIEEKYGNINISKSLIFSKLKKNESLCCDKYKLIKYSILNNAQKK